MTIQELLDMTWIPLIAFAICLGYGVALLITKNPKTLKGKNDKTVYKDAEQFAIKTAWLLLMLAASALAMCVLIFYNLYAALGEVIVCFLIFTVLWRRVNTKYGQMGA